eukprot:1106336-Amphidinium_carterae.2
MERNRAIVSRLRPVAGRLKRIKSKSGLCMMWKRLSPISFAQTHVITLRCECRSTGLLSVRAGALACWV